jgi:hypothetical protein
MTSFIEIARGIKKSPWFTSDQYSELLLSNYKSYFSRFTGQVNLKLHDADNWYSSHVHPVDNFFNFYYLLGAAPNSFKDFRWLSSNSLEQKFNKMFSGSSTQQRIISNWRQLKFSREAWRCKLLAARHQNTLYRRFTGEEGYV